MKLKNKKIGIVDPIFKCRLLVLTDIGNEPDDQQSLIRLLTYANELDIEGVIATTSRWQKNIIRPDLIEDVINVYGGVPRQNLMIHTNDYFPTEEELCALIKKGPSKYGMEAVGTLQDSEGSEWLIKVVDRPDPRPIWITIWGGSNCLAQALYKVKHRRTKKERDAFIEKIRVYAIADQDDTGKWIRSNFKDLFYIVSPSDPSTADISNEDYQKATWTGISGELFYKFKGGPNSKLITNRWVRENIRLNHGPLGKIYPRIAFAMEGDTPSFLNLIPNGLRSSQSPTFGGWGGRYELYQPKGEDRPIFTNSEDTVFVGTGFGKIKGDKEGIYKSNQATIWRWREAYQNDFAARMDWAATSHYEDANHPPEIKINGKLDLTVNGNEIVNLDAEGTSDPDGNDL